MSFIETACEQIVSPPKFKYSYLDLGSILMPTGRRYDFSVLNKFQQTLKCSLYVPKFIHPSQLCVIYLHSMNGSRLQCMSYVERILEMGLFFFSFDFSGCGNSDGNTISFGANEKYDIDVVIEHLAQQYRIIKFILWGRSMGAVSALKYQQLLTQKFTHVQIHGIILDSPFRSLKQLIVELGTQRMNVPKIIIQAGFHIIKRTLQKKGNFDIEDLQLIDTVKNINDVSLIFLVSKNDTTIDPAHSLGLYEAFPYKDKELVYFTGLHNESRDQQYLRNVTRYIQDRMCRRSEKKSNIRYKRIKLEEQAIKASELEQDELTNECRCQFFPFTSSTI